MRRVTVAIRPVGVAVACLLALPILVGLGASLKAKADVVLLQENYAALELENATFRAATEALSGQIQSLQAAITDLGVRSALDPDLAAAMEKLPAKVKSNAMGGGTPAASSTVRQALSAMTTPEDTFGLLRAVLEGVESRLHVVSTVVDQRNALADATPSIWPAHGWLSSTLGMRRDPITGKRDFHSGLDIAGERGQPVYVTASGTVTHAGSQGNYGKLIIVDHGFGLQTRYGHLLDYKVREGDEVKRGDQIGRVGATGRATGFHLHYEVLANGRLLNPLQLLTRATRR